MKTAVLLRLLTVGLVGIGAIQSCSSKDEAATEEPVAPDTEENAATEGEANTEEGEENENATSEEEAGAEENADAAAAAEGGMDAAAESNIDADAAAIAEAIGGGSTVANVDSGAMPSDSSDQASSSQVEMAPDAMAAPSEGGVVAQPMSGGSVKYVRSSSVNVHSAPDAGSAVVRQLNKGDHMLVTIEGSWARLSDGGFVAMQGLSDKGIGRPRSAGAWR